MKRKVLILSDKKINTIVKKSQLYNYIQIQYFDGIFEFFESKRNLKDIESIIIEENICNTENFFEEVNKIQKYNEEAKIIIILKEYNYILMEKLEKININDIYIDDDKRSINIVEIIIENIDDPYLKSLVIEEKEEFLRTMVFDYNKNKTKKDKNILKSILINMKKILKIKPRYKIEKFENIKKAINLK